MQVYEGRLKVFLLKDIPISAVQEKISALIDKALVQNEKWRHFIKRPIIKITASLDFIQWNRKESTGRIKFTLYRYGPLMKT